MRDRDRQDKQQNGPLRDEVGIAWRFQEPSGVLCDDVARAGDVTLDKKAPRVPDHASRQTAQPDSASVECHAAPPQSLFQNRAQDDMRGSVHQSVGRGYL